MKIGSQVKMRLQSLVEATDSIPQSMFINSPHIGQSSHIFRKSNYRTQIFKKVNFVRFISLEMVYFLSAYYLFYLSSFIISLKAVEVSDFK